MPIEVQVEGLPLILDFEDGTSDEVIGQAVKRESALFQKDQAATEGEAAQRNLAVLEPAMDFVRGMTLQGLGESAGWALNYTGKVASGLAQDLAAGDTTMPRTGFAATGQEAPEVLKPQTPIGQGLAAGVEGLPLMATSMALAANGIPPAIAFGGPMAVSTYKHALDVGATESQAAAQAAFAFGTGAVIPGVAQAGGQAVARVLGQAVQRGLLSPSATAMQKGLEILGSQGVAQTFMEGLNLPEYYTATPEERWAMLQRNLAANALPILALDVPNVLSSRPSQTQARAFAKVGEVLERLGQTPEGREGLLELVDETAMDQATELPRDSRPKLPVEGQEISPTGLVPAEVAPQASQGPVGKSVIYREDFGTGRVRLSTGTVKEVTKKGKWFVSNGEESTFVPPENAFFGELSPELLAELDAANKRMDFLNDATREGAAMGARGTGRYASELKTEWAAYQELVSRIAESVKPKQTQPSPSDALGSVAGPGTLAPPPTGTLAPKLEARLRFKEVTAGLDDMTRSVGGDPVVRSKRFGQKALGIFKPFSRVVRMGDMNDLPTRTHEVAHHISRMLYEGNISKAVPAPVAAELVKLGRALYGTKKPAGGYTEEGWAEFWRYHLTTEESAVLAPQTAKWVGEKLLAEQPALAKTYAEARKRIDTWRAMSVLERHRPAEHPNPHEKNIRSLAKTWFSFKGAIEAAAPLRDMARQADTLLREQGEQLRARDNPYLLEKYFTGEAGWRVNHMVEKGMLDIWGQPTGGRSLSEAIAPAVGNMRPGESRQERITQFFQYLQAKRSQERWDKGLNPGISRIDADEMVRQLERPEYQLAADGYWEWWGGVRDYVSAASPSMAALMDAFEVGSKFYAPLARELDPGTTKDPTTGSGQANSMKRFGGSPKPVLNIQTQTLLSAEHMINAAHRAMVLEAVYNLANKVPGLGRYVERIPPEQRKLEVGIGRMRNELEAMGIDTSAVPDDALLTYYQVSNQSSGTDPILIRRQNTPPGQPPAPAEWYHVDKDLYNSLQGMRIADIGALGNINELLARSVRAGSTTLRASFGLVGNPIIDLPDALINSRTANNPAAFLLDYFRMLGGLIGLPPGQRARLELEAFRRAGVSGSTMMGADIDKARQAGKRMFQGRVMRQVVTPVETYRELVSLMESPARAAEYARIGRELGWVPGSIQTPEQAILQAVGAAEITTDFRRRGDFNQDTSSAALQRGAPYTNAAKQGLRTVGRTLQRAAHSPRVAASVAFNGGIALLLPTLANWWQNKDKEWFKALSARERLSYWHIEKPSGEVLIIPKARGWGIPFSALPEVLMDRLYADEPLRAKEVMQAMFRQVMPYTAPVLIQFLKEQWANEVDYSGKPIVPKAKLNLLPGAQGSGYSTAFAMRLGELLPGNISPARVDHAVRSLAGGAPMDVLQSFGLAQKQQLRGKENADTFLVGRLWRRGGTYTAQSRWLEDGYRIADGWAKALASQEHFPLEVRDLSNGEVFLAQWEAVRTVQSLIEMIPDPATRRARYEYLNGKVKGIVLAAQRNKALPEDRKINPRQKPLMQQLQEQRTTPQSSLSE